MEDNHPPRALKNGQEGGCVIFRTMLSVAQAACFSLRDRCVFFEEGGEIPLFYLYYLVLCDGRKRIYALHISSVENAVRSISSHAIYIPTAFF